MGVEGLEALMLTRTCTENAPSAIQQKQMAALLMLKSDVQVKADLNDPEIRWRFEQGYGKLNCAQL